MAPLQRLKLWYRILGRSDKILIWLLCLSAIPATLSNNLAASIVFFITASWAVVRIVQLGLRRVIWSLRNRLLVAYLFIAVVPILLIATLVGLVMYTYTGQVAFFLVNSELDRRHASLREIARHLLAASPEERAVWVRHSAPLLENRFPGLQVQVRGDSEWNYPSTSASEEPAAAWSDASGLVLKDEFLYLWARARKGAAEATVLAPVTQELLGDLVPNLGEVSIINLDVNPLRGRHIRIARGAAEPGKPNRNRLPDSSGRFDIEVRAGNPIPVALWEKPGEFENELLRVRSRPRTVIDTIFAQRGTLGEGQGAILTFLVVISILFLVAELISLFIGINISRTITGAVHDLYEGTEKVMHGDFTHRIEVKGQDQVALLSTSFNRMTENVERLLAVSKEKERLQAELEIAREVQNQLYPRCTPNLKSLELTAYCDPARTVSGDYYDYQPLDPSRIAIAMGDVAGKGISAALLMATVQSSLRTQIRGCMDAATSKRVTMSTSRLVSQLNQQLYATTSPEKFATFYFSVFDEEEGTLTYTNAGHLPPILLRNGEAQRLDVNGMVVGAFPFAQYDESVLHLLPNDILVCFTDGITEPENEYGEMYTEERLIDVLLRHADRSNQEIIQAVMESVRQWTGSPELQDDMTLLLARRIG